MIRNTGIARSEDDTQPYIVFTQEQIQRSGATNLEEFFRDQLTVDNGAGQVPSILLDPVVVTRENIRDTVIADGFTTPLNGENLFSFAAGPPAVWRFVA